MFDEEMDGLDGIDFILREDFYSMQVRSDHDPLFWLRVVDKPDRQIITDFNIGGFPVQHAGQLLFNAFETISFFPKQLLVIRCADDLQRTLEQGGADLVTMAKDFLQTFDLQLIKSESHDIDGRQAVFLYTAVIMDHLQGPAQLRVV